MVQFTTLNCPVCNSPNAQLQRYNLELSQNTITLDFYRCPVCGKFEFKSYDPDHKMDMNHLACYFAYNGFSITNSNDNRYHTVLDKDACDELKTNLDYGHPVHIDAQIVKTWYPTTFAERIDSILLYLGLHTRHIGDDVELSPEQLLGILFIDRWEYENESSVAKMQSRDSGKLSAESKYMLRYLVDKQYIRDHVLANGKHTIQLMPEGYFRVDTLQRNMSTGKRAFVAMKFGEETRRLREAIRKGVSDAGYIATFIDEVQHNNPITPEILKHIRDSKFVVVDLTYQNNGAYFEEGYAIGIGKPVIQLCQKDDSLHFDIAQKNTIMWDTEDDIPSRLTNRIRATID